MNDLVQSPGITRLSKSQVSEMAHDLDEEVEQFRTRPLDAGPSRRAATVQSQATAGDAQPISSTAPAGREAVLGLGSAWPASS